MLFHRMSRSSSPEVPKERRERQRFPVRLMLDVACGHKKFQRAVSRDASEIGISFFCVEAIAVGEQIELNVHVPEVNPERKRAVVRGSGTIVRSEQRPSGHYLIAARTNGYRFSE